MKHSVIICYIIMTVLLLSCNRRQSNTREELLPPLAEAERLMYPHPDSALHILQNIDLDQEMDAYQRANWAVLMTQARYKCDILQSDSLINTAYFYFMDKGDEQRKVLVNYLKGAIYGERNNVEKAQEYLLRAIQYADNIKDYQLACLIHSDLGKIYIYRSLIDYAAIHFEKAVYYAKLSNNKQYIANSYIYMARLCASQKQDNESLKWYNKVIEFGTKENLPGYVAPALSESSFFYRKKKDYKKAISLVKKSLSIEKTDQNKLTLGNLYRNTSQYDSAYYYLNQSILSNNIYTVSSAYQALFYMAEKMKDYKLAMEYSQKIWQFQDSINSIERSKTLIEMQEKYDQQKVINERNELKIEKDKTIRNALIGIIALMGIIAIIVYFYQRKLLRKNKELQQKEESIRAFTLQIGENEKQISRNQARMEELQTQMEESKEIQEQWEEQQKMLQEMQLQNEALMQDNRTLQENIDTYSRSLHEKSKDLDALNQLSEENQQLHKRELFLCNQLIKSDDFFMQMKALNYVSDEQWEKIKERIDFLFDGYTKRLREQISLTEGDIRLCCLIKLHFSNSEITNLLAISPASVYKKKLRLKEHILKKIESFGENKTLELWLMEY